MMCDSVSDTITIQGTIGTIVPQFTNEFCYCATNKVSGKGYKVIGIKIQKVQGFASMDSE